MGLIEEEEVRVDCDEDETGVGDDEADECAKLRVCKRGLSVNNKIQSMAAHFYHSPALHLLLTDYDRGDVHHGGDCDDDDDDDCVFSFVGRRWSVKMPKRKRKKRTY